MIVLRVEQGAHAGTTLELTSGAVFGRGDVDVKIDDPEVSRRHASIRVSPGTAEIADLGSKNGTKVNGSRVVVPQALRVGDLVEIGDTRLLVLSIDEAVASPDELGQTEPPPEPFSIPERSSGRRVAVASRHLSATLVAYGAVLATAVALLLYFSAR
jgi:FHA domain